MPNKKGKKSKTENADLPKKSCKDKKRNPWRLGENRFKIEYYVLVV